MIRLFLVLLTSCHQKLIIFVNMIIVIAVFKNQEVYLFNLIVCNQYLNFRKSNKKVHMSSKCISCSQQVNNYEVLTCGHTICVQCLPSQNICNVRFITCNTCSTMTLITNKQQPDFQFNPENYVVCLDCRSDVMSTRVFLGSEHRSHRVVSVINVIHDVQKSLRKYQLTLDLQSKGLYSQIQLLSRQKREVAQQYNKNCETLHQKFQSLRHQLQTIQKDCIKQYEKQVLKILSQYENKAKKIKNQIIKCQSYIQCIDYNLVTNNTNKYVTATQFYFQHFAKFDNQIEILCQCRKAGVVQFGVQYNVKVPDFRVFQDVYRIVRTIQGKIWGTFKQENRQALKMEKESEQKISQSYFEQKRREILSLTSSNMQQTKKNPSTLGLQTRISGLTTANTAQKQKQGEKNVASPCMQPQKTQSYNIDGRIENLRKALKLGQRKYSNNASIVVEGNNNNRSFGMFSPKSTFKKVY